MSQQRLRLLLLCKRRALLDRLGTDSRGLLSLLGSDPNARATLIGLVNDYLRSVSGLEELDARVVELPWTTDLPPVELPGYASIPQNVIEQAAENRGYLPIAIDVSSAPKTYETLRQIIPIMQDRMPELVCVGNDTHLDSTLWGGHAAFGNRTQAATLVGRDVMKAKGLDGTGVAVMVVDQGFNASYFGLPNARLFNVPGQAFPPGQGRSDHGEMIVRNMLNIAPKARYFDIPLIPMPPAGLPATIDPDFTVFSSHAVGVLANCLTYVSALQEFNIPCVLVNAWGIFNTAAGRTPIDIAALHDYSLHAQHPLNFVASEISDAGGDVVFAAGNCGQFAPDPRCGEHDRGPGRSILGAASLDKIISVGAARVDTTWLGYSAQGKGPSGPGLQKPDLCAPSQFHEDDDMRQLNTGTSAAAAVAAGVAAALRSGAPCRLLSSGAFKAHLVSRARSVHGTGWDSRFGFGLVNGA